MANFAVPSLKSAATSFSCNNRSRSYCELRNNTWRSSNFNRNNIWCIRQRRNSTSSSNSGCSKTAVNGAIKWYALEFGASVKVDEQPQLGCNFAHEEVRYYDHNNAYQHGHNNNVAYEYDHDYDNAHQHVHGYGNAHELDHDNNAYQCDHDYDIAYEYDNDNNIAYEYDHDYDVTSLFIVC
ncbi:hypothetical protein AAVH_12119 [Aphelenchoides avenae]|nr:hypothetical protein AAVH_12119 [Aphelenchus avenae]